MQVQHLIIAHAIQYLMLMKPCIAILESALWYDMYHITLKTFSKIRHQMYKPMPLYDEGIYISIMRRAHGSCCPTYNFSSSGIKRKIIETSTIVGLLWCMFQIRSLVQFNTLIFSNYNSTSSISKTIWIVWRFGVRYIS